MKHYLLGLAMLSVCFSSQAQSTRSIFKADRRVSAANYLAYPGPQKQPFTPAPKGYVPFYLSHYGRHGSRWLIGERDYQRPVVWLMQADSLGKLTPKGKEVLQKLRIIRDAAAGRDGELTLLGAQQHQQIAARMMKNFPEIFAGKTHIDAKSTTIIRCILSMENALQQLVRRNPQLVISHDASNHDMYYMNHDDTTLFKKRFTATAKQAYLDFKKQHEQPARVMNELFNDAQYWKNHVDTLALYETLFRQAGNLQSTELRHTMSLYDLFTDDELYNLWQVQNAYWYIAYGPSPLNGGHQPSSQRFLLRKIIAEADSCIRFQHPGATLRYGHDTMVMPLSCLMNLDNLGMRVDNLGQLDERGWQDYRIFPMACNIQLVFYRHPTKKDILVKILRNEHEARLPIDSATAPYYKWSDVKAYFLARIHELEAN